MSWRDRPISRQAVIASGLCIGCGACAGQAGMGWDHNGHRKPTGPRDWLGQPDPRLTRTCPFSPAARDEDRISAARFPSAPHRDDRIGRFEAAYVGHVAEGGFRVGGSSGGMATWTAAALLRTGLVDGVAHVVPTDPALRGRLFTYRISRSEMALREGAKSRYYPVDLSQVLDEIRATPGRYAIVGVPCFIKAVHLLCAEEPVLGERIRFTLGLFCGHMKSAFMVESFAWQMGRRIGDVAGIDYRRKDPSRPANWYRAELALHGGDRRMQDWRHDIDGDWGAGFFQNSACDFCDDVTAETADIAFGDAWVEPYSADGRGTNVVIARAPILRDLVEEGIAANTLALLKVDADFVAQTQGAGLRQRREGLAFRLSRKVPGLRPAKRERLLQEPTSARRRLIYRLRAHISRWSHRMLRLARWLDRPSIYMRWARAMSAIYHGLAYGRGRSGKVAAWIGRLP